MPLTSKVTTLFKGLAYRAVIIVFFRSSSTSTQIAALSASDRTSPLCSIMSHSASMCQKVAAAAVLLPLVLQLLGLSAKVNVHGAQHSPASGGSCHTPPPGYSSALCNAGLAHPRDALLDTQADSFSGCSELCLATETCAMFTYRDLTRRCWLSQATATTDKAGSSSFIRDATAAMAAAPASEATCSPAAGATPLGYYAAECGTQVKEVHCIAVHTRQALAGCAALCREEPRCLLFTYHQNTGKCWLGDHGDTKPADKEFATFHKAKGPSMLEQPEESPWTAGCLAACDQMHLCLAVDTATAAGNTCHQSGVIPLECLPSALADVSFLCDTGYRHWFDANVFPTVSSATLAGCRRNCRACPTMCSGFPASLGGPPKCEDLLCNL